MNKKFLQLPLVFLTILSSCHSGTETKPDANAGQQKLISDSTMALLQIDTIRYHNVGDEVKLTGEVSFDENKVVKVYPFSSGQVLAVNVSVGDYVRAGQTLATIRSADVAGNYADLSAAGSDVAIAKKAMENSEHLYNNGIASQREFIEAKENYKKAMIAQQKINTQISINGGGHTSASGTYIVAAPRSGYVVEKLINPGNFIRNDNSSNMFTIGDIGDVWIWANVFEADVAKVKPGYAAAVTTVAYPDSTFLGKVDKVNQTLDPVTKVMRIRVVLPNKSGMLKPEMFANITITNQEDKRELSVPSTAIISENGKNYLVIFNNANDVKVQEITILKANGGNTFVSGNISEGQKVITKNQILIYRKLTEK